MTTNSQHLAAHAERKSIPLRTLDQVRAVLSEAKRRGTDISMARLMLRHGRMTDEARNYVAAINALANRTVRS